MPERPAKALRPDLVLLDGRVVEDAQVRPDGTLIVVARWQGQRAEAVIVRQDQIVGVLGELRADDAG